MSKNRPTPLTRPLHIISTFYPPDAPVPPGVEVVYVQFKDKNTVRAFIATDEKDEHGMTLDEHDEYPLRGNPVTPIPANRLDQYRHRILWWMLDASLPFGIPPGIKTK